MLIFEENELLKLDKDVRRFHKLWQNSSTNTSEFNKLSKEKAKEYISKIYDNYIEQFKKIEDKFAKVIKSKLPPNIRSKVTFLHQTKSLSSILDKVLERNKSIFRIADLIRGALLFPDAESAQKWVDDFRKKNPSMISDYEFKSKGSDKAFGYYGSHHMDLNIDGMDVELQIMPKKLWTYKEPAHHIYNRWRSTTGVPDPEDKQRSFNFFFKGNQPKPRRESIKEIIREIIREEIRLALQLG